jgi:hypothetical protein
MLCHRYRCFESANLNSRREIYKILKENSLKKTILGLMLVLLVDVSVANEILVNITGFEERKQFDGKLSVCEFKYDITNNSTGTLHRIQLELDGWDDRGAILDDVSSMQLDNGFYDRQIVSIAVGSTASFQSVSGFKTECAWMGKIKVTNVHPAHCNVRMLPEDVDCEDILWVTSSIESLEVENLRKFRPTKNGQTHDSASSGHDASVGENQSLSEIYAGEILHFFLTLMAITKDQKYYALPNWHDLEDSIAIELEWERKYNDEPFEYWVTQTSNPFFAEKRATRFVMQGHGTRANIGKLELQTHDGAEFRSLLDRLSKIENVEILDTRCDSESNASGQVKHSIIEYDDHKPIYVYYSYSAGSGGVWQRITFEILEKSNKNLPELDTSDGAMGVWEKCDPSYY